MFTIKAEYIDVSDANMARPKNEKMHASIHVGLYACVLHVSVVMLNGLAILCKHIRRDTRTGQCTHVAHTQDSGSAYLHISYTAKKCRNLCAFSCLFVCMYVYIIYTYIYIYIHTHRHICTHIHTPSILILHIQK